MLVENFDKEFENHGFVKEIDNLEKGGTSKLFDFYDETTSFGLMCKMEKINSYGQILNFERSIFLNILAVEIEKEENRKKGLLKNVIEKLDFFCKKQRVSLLVSNILEDNFVRILNKNGFGIISLEYTKPVTIFKNTLDEESMNDLLKKSYEIHCFKIFD